MKEMIEKAILYLTNLGFVEEVIFLVKPNGKVLAFRSRAEFAKYGDDKNAPSWSEQRGDNRRGANQGDGVKGQKGRRD